MNPRSDAPSQSDTKAADMQKLARYILNENAEKQNQFQRLVAANKAHVNEPLQLKAGSRGASDYNGLPLLAMALTQARPSTVIVQTLLENKADATAAITRPGYAGWTVLMLLAARNNDSLLTLLNHLSPSTLRQAACNYPAQIGFDREVTTPLMIAARAGVQTNVKLLTQHGANVTAKTSAGEAALSLAHQSHHQNIVRMLDNKAEKATVVKTSRDVVIAKKPKKKRTHVEMTFNPLPVALANLFKPHKIISISHVKKESTNVVKKRRMGSHE